MSRQEGLIRLRGSMDGLTFYKAYGKDIVRKSGGPTREQIMTGKKFARTRENLSEFAGCSKISKSFRDSLTPVLDLADGQMRNRATKVFRFVTSGDDGVRGQRDIRLSRHRDAFKMFECNIKRSLSKSLSGIVETTHTDDRMNGTVTLNAGFAVDAKSTGATHFRFEHALGVVSDFIYDSAVKGYVTATPTFNTYHIAQHSEYFEVEEKATTPYTSTVSLPITSPLPDTDNVVHALGIRLFLRIGGIYSPLAQSHVLTVLEVF